MGDALGIACVLTFALAGCQPMYGKPSEKLKNPPVIRHEIVVEPKPKIPFVENCGNIQFRAPNKGIVRDSGAAAQLVKDADTKLTNASNTETLDAKKDLILQSIEKYHRALARDPYDVDATLKLALVYHKVQRKGCALAMLRRLEMLANHPAFSQAANRSKEQVRDNRDWFEGFRDEALKEIP